MSVGRIAALRAAVPWTHARSPIVRSCALQSSGLASASRDAFPLHRGGAFRLRTPASIRWVSDEVPSQDKESSEDSSLSDMLNFRNPEHQKLADQSRNDGWLVLRSNVARDGAPFLKFGPFFLRENCQCSSCVHPDTKQRSFDPFSIPADVTAVEAKATTEGARVQWSDGHSSIYPWEWLRTHQQCKVRHGRNLIDGQRPGSPRPFRFFRPGKDEYPEVAYEDVMAKDEAMLRWLDNIWNWGFCFVKGVPVDPESTKALIERIAFIRHTHYGDFWDFTADLTFKDTAYTNEYLGAHTDNTYFTDPARLQLFHLLSHTDGHGGASLLVDGFAAAATLRSSKPHYYNALSATRHPWHASGNEDVCIQPSALAPVFSEHPDTASVYQIRWNNYDRGPKTNWRPPEQRLWYQAARRYNFLLNDMNRQIWTQLEPGTALIFDNWRMLHGRSEFTGKRRMCGGYVNNDDFVSRLRLLKYGREKVLNEIGNVWDAQRTDCPYYIY